MYLTKEQLEEIGYRFKENERGAWVMNKYDKIVSKVQFSEMVNVTVLGLSFASKEESEHILIAHANNDYQFLKTVHGIDPKIEEE